MIISSESMFVCEWELPSGISIMVSANHIQINHRHPAVRDDLHAWGSWILDVCGWIWQPSLVYSDADIPGNRRKWIQVGRHQAYRSKIRLRVCES